MSVTDIQVHTTCLHTCTCTHMTSDEDGHSISNSCSDVDAHEKNVNAGSTKSAIMYMVEIIEDRFDIHTLIAMALM